MSNILKFLAQSPLFKSQASSKSLFFTKNVSIIRFFVDNASPIRKVDSPLMQRSRVGTVLRKSDRVPEGYELIYKSSLRFYVVYLYHTSLVLVAIGILSVYETFTNEEKVTNEEGKINFANRSEIILTYSFYFFLNFVLFWVCARHPYRVYHNAEKNRYKMILAHWKYPFNKSVDFTSETVQKTYKNPWNSVMQASHLVNGRAYHIMPDCFKSPVDYYKMMGNNELI